MATTAALQDDIQARVGAPDLHLQMLLFAALAPSESRAAPATELLTRIDELELDFVELTELLRQLVGADAAVQHHSARQTSAPEDRPQGRSSV